MNDSLITIPKYVAANLEAIRRFEGTFERPWERSWQVEPGFWPAKRVHFAHRLLTISRPIRCVSCGDRLSSAELQWSVRFRKRANLKSATCFDCRRVYS